MKTRILIYLAGFILLVLASAANAQGYKLQLASDIWPPFTNQPSEKKVALDLVNLALSRSGVSMTTEILQFEEVIEKIKSTEVDGSAALWITEERQEFLLFSAPYLQNQLILVGRKGSDVSARQLSQLEGRTLAVVESYAYGPELEDSGVELMPGPSEQQNLQSLMDGKVDYMLVEALLVQNLLTNQPEQAAKYLEVGLTPLLTRSLHLGIRKDVPGAEDIMAGFNKQILGMIADGSYNKILQLNWIMADLNGDGQVELILAGDKAGKVAPSNTYGLFHQRSSQPPQGYMVEGNFYKDWDSIPSEYKANIYSDPNQRGLLHFPIGY